MEIEQEFFIFSAVLKGYSNWADDHTEKFFLSSLLSQRTVLLKLTLYTKKENFHKPSIYSVGTEYKK